MGRFPTTRWTLVRQAAGPEAQRSALSELCSAYWPPVYAFIRRHERDPEQAKDLTQAFFLRLLEKHDLFPSHLEYGRFRSYLLACVEHFLSNERDRARAQKRGGGQIPFSIDVGEEHVWREPVDTLTPDRIFEKHWATMMLNRALQELRCEFESSGKGALFEALKDCFASTGDMPAYREVGASLEMTEAAVKAAAFRMRRRFRDLLLEEIARTVEDPSEVDEELRYLISVMSR